MTMEEFREVIREAYKKLPKTESGPDFGEDNYGQIIIYTGLMQDLSQGWNGPVIEWDYEE